MCKSDFEALDVYSNTETCREEFLTFFRADILGGSSCNKPLSDSERPEPSWGGAHSPSQAGAAVAEPRGGCLVFLSCCHPVIGVRTHRTAVVTPSRHTGSASSDASHISPGYLVQTKHKYRFIVMVYGVWEESVAKMSSQYCITVIWIQRHGCNVGFTKCKLLPLVFCSTAQLFPRIYILCTMLVLFILCAESKNIFRGTSSYFHMLLQRLGSIVIP